MSASSHPIPLGDVPALATDVRASNGLASPPPVEPAKPALKISRPPGADSSDDDCALATETIELQPRPQIRAKQGTARDGTS